MLFNSSIFFAFYAAFFPLYWLVHRNRRARTLLILVGSYVFYGAWDWRFLSLIIASTIVDFFCGGAIAASPNPKTRRRLLYLSLGVNLGALGVFKYYGFFVQTFVDFANTLGWHPHPAILSIVLPVGISFYTFQTLTYTIDIYRRELKPTDDLIGFAAFVAFFPQLVAGPIERAADSSVAHAERINGEVPRRLREYRPFTSEVSPTFEEMLRAIAAECDLLGVRLVTFTAPIYQPLRDQLDPAVLARFRKTAASVSPYLDFNERYPSWKPLHFADPTHLAPDGEGARMVTADLRRFLR